MSNKKYQILLREVLFQGFFRVDRLHLQHERFDGEQSPQHDKVVLVEQFRAAPANAGINPWMIEVVMGMVDAGETPEQAARREALEEAGCAVRELHPIANFFSSPGGTSEYIHMFAGRITAPTEGGIFGMRGENEDIRVHVLDAVKAINLLYTNKIRDAQTLLAMQWFAMHHTDLRNRWLVGDVGTPII